VVEPTDLLGTWQLERRIVTRDGERRQFGRVRGTLTLTPDGDAVGWHERGTLSWNGRQLAVTRLLRVVRRDDGWMVCFDHGGDFHPWRPGAPVVHPCRADTYCGLVDVDDACSQLRVLWDVTGPAKDHRFFTRCTRTPR
jgi:hypothetical protein